jgi:hypothetical protein
VDVVVLPEGVEQMLCEHRVAAVVRLRTGRGRREGAKREEEGKRERRGYSTVAGEATMLLRGAGAQKRLSFSLEREDLEPYSTTLIPLPLLALPIPSQVTPGPP